jgi:superfamily II DNA or RNA helicase
LGGIQSLYRNAHRLPRIDLVIVDEAHLVLPRAPATAQQFHKDYRIDGYSIPSRQRNAA